MLFLDLSFCSQPSRTSIVGILSSPKELAKVDRRRFFAWLFLALFKLRLFRERSEVMKKLVLFVLVFGLGLKLLLKSGRGLFFRDVIRQSSVLLFNSPKSSWAVPFFPRVGNPLRDFRIRGRPPTPGYFGEGVIGDREADWKFGWPLPRFPR